MTQFNTDVDKEVHRKLASSLFNFTWDLIEKADRTEEDKDLMLNAAHASRFHWGVVGTALNRARGEWQISRVYSILGRIEPALYHAGKSLELCLDNQLSDFDLGFSYEALARAYAVMGDKSKRDENMAHAKQAATRVSKEDDRKWLLKNIDEIGSHFIAN